MENKEMQKLGDQEIQEVSGGRTGLFKKPQIFKTYCDYCRERIDGTKRFEVPINVSGKVMCNECFERQKSALGAEVANEKWIKIKTPIVPPKNTK